MAEPVIAIIFDFDDTLGPDTISSLVKNYSIEPMSFWEEINGQVKRGYDPPQAYMNRILRYVREGEMRGLTKEKLREIGSKLRIFQGLPEAFSKEEAERTISSPWRKKEFKDIGLKLEFYIISGGLEEMIRGTALAKNMNGIFGCNFDYDPSTNVPVAVKSTMSFTEKTRFIFAINKGISEEAARSKPYRINDSIPEEERRVPFKNMIYIGDGPSDIPCLSVICKNRGIGIGASPPMKSFKKGYELARGKRITIGPYTADYRKGTDMRKAIKQAVLSKGLEIVMDRKKHVIRAPHHS